MFFHGVTEQKNESPVKLKKERTTSPGFQSPDRENENYYLGRFGLKADGDF